MNSLVFTQEHIRTAAHHFGVDEGQLEGAVIMSDNGGAIEPRVWRIGSVFINATAILGSPENAVQWMMAEIGRLQYRRPLDILETDDGEKTVMEALRWYI